MYCWGWNAYNQLGLEGEVVNFPTKVPKFKNSVVSVKSKGFFTLMLDSRGNVWLAGNCEPGVNKGWTQVNSGDLCMKRVVQIATGAFHSLALDDEGCVYGWGSNQKNQLGLEIVHQETPKLLGNAECVECGYSTSYYSIKNKVASFGDNEFGQRGIGHNKPEPGVTWMPEFTQESIISISAGDSHVLFLTEKGKVFSCGSYQYGRLGRSVQDSSMLPRQVSVLEPYFIKQVSAGGACSAAVSVKHFLFTWGSGTWGQLGNSTTEDYYVPQKIRTDVLCVATGSDHMVAVNKHKELLVWGRGASGRLRYKNYNLLTPTSLGNFNVNYVWAGAAQSFAGYVKHKYVKTKELLTDPLQCLVDFKKILSVGEVFEVKVQSMDSKGKQKRKGGDFVEVCVDGKVLLTEDCRNGFYLAKLSLHRTGKHQLRVKVNFIEVGKWNFQVVSGEVSTEKSEFKVTGNKLTGEELSLEIQLKDFVGNSVTTERSKLLARLTSQQLKKPITLSQEDNKFCGVFMVKIPGYYSLEVCYRDKEEHKHLQGSSFFMFVSPGKTYSPSCLLSFQKSFLSGEEIQAVIHAKDRFGNPREIGGDLWKVEVTGEHEGSVRVTDESNGKYAISGVMGSEEGKLFIDVLGQDGLRVKNAPAQIEIIRSSSLFLT